MSTKQKQIKRDLQKITKELIEIILQKNADYGDSYANLGERGLFVRVHDKVMRLQTLIWEKKQPKVKNETIDDTIKDLTNYCLLWLHFRQQKKKQANL